MCYIFEITSVMHNLFEKAVFPLKTHCPHIYQWAKGFYHLRVVFNIMMFWTKFGKVFCSNSLCSEIFHSRKWINSSVKCDEKTNSSTSFRSVSISHTWSALGISWSSINGRSLRRDQFSWPFPPVVPLEIKVFGMICGWLVFV